MRGQNISSLQKKRKHAQWLSATIGIQIKRSRLTSRNLKTKVVKLVDGWQIYRVHGLLCFPPKSQNPSTAFLPSQWLPDQTPPPNKRRKKQIWTRAKYSWLQGGPALMLTQGIDQYIPAPDTKLTPHHAMNFIIGLLWYPFGNCLPGTELLQSPFRTELSMGSLSRWYWRSLRHHCRFCRVIADPCGVVAIPEVIGSCTVTDADSCVTH